MSTDPRWQKDAFGVDLSGIQKVVDYPALAPYVDFYIARLGHGKWTYNNIADPAVAIDAMFATHCQGAWDTGKPFGAYFVFDPTVDADPGNPLMDRQIKVIMAALKGKVGKSVHFLAIDVEIGKGPDGGNIPSVIISTKVMNMVKALHNIYPTLRIGIYTGQWFIDQFSKDLGIGINELYSSAKDWFFTWIARYPNDSDWTGTGIQKAQWSDFRDKFAPEWPVDKAFPWMCNGGAKIWQYSGDKYTADGYYGEVKGALSSLDLNYFDGTLGELHIWCSYMPHYNAPNTTPTTTPTVPTSNLTDSQKLDAIYKAVVK